MSWSGEEANQLASSLVLKYCCIVRPVNGFTTQRESGKFYYSCYFIHVVIYVTSRLQTPTPDSYRGIHRGDGAGLKYAEEVRKVIERINTEGKQVDGC